MQLFAMTILDLISKKFLYHGIHLYPPMVQEPLPPGVDQGPLIIETSRSNSDTPQSVGLLWTNDQPTVETST